MSKTWAKYHRTSFLFIQGKKQKTLNKDTQWIYSE
jgi:hypothetical protein